MLSLTRTFAQNSSQKPVFELRRVVVDIDPGSVIGYYGESGLGEEIEIGKIKFYYTKAFIYNNFFSEDEIGERLQKEMTRQGLNMMSANHIFTELQENKKADYSIAIRISRLRMNQQGILESKNFHSYINADVQILNLKSNRLELDRSLEFEFLSMEHSDQKETESSFYFSKAWTKMVEDLLNNNSFKRILETQSYATEGNELSEKIVLIKPFKREQNLNIKKAKESVVTIIAGNKSGSGVIVSESGLVLTCFHNVAGYGNPEIILSNNIKLKAKLLRSVTDFDIALLQIEGATAVPLPTGKSSEVSIGDEVWAIGTPGFTELGQTVTKGIISGERTIDDRQYLQTDASVSPGNSGGPLINTKGEVIGIVNAKVIAKGMEGIGFSIPISVALEKLNIDVK